MTILSRTIKGVYANHDGLITGVNYAIAALDGPHSAKFEATADIPYAGGEVIPFDHVSPSVVFGWLHGLGVDADAIEAQLVAQLAYQASVPQLVPLVAVDAPVEHSADLDIPPVPEAQPANA